jgi:hypothetical protein
MQVGKQRMAHPPLYRQRNEPLTLRLRDGDLDAAPLARHERRRHQAHHRVSLAQLNIKPVLPHLADLDTIAAVKVHEYLMAGLNQQPVHLPGHTTILARMAQKHSRQARPPAATTVT